MATMELTVLTEPIIDECECLPLIALSGGQAQQGDDYRPMTPVTPELGGYLREHLSAYFPRSSPISVLLLHISQLEQAHISPKFALLYKRRRFHAPESFMEQVLANVRRSIRGSDQLIMHGGAGAAIIFPGVDREGAFSITERVYHSINLLQPDTVIPPLARETDIFVSMGSYPEPANTLEGLLHQTGYVVHRLTLRPAVTAQLRAHGAESEIEAESSVRPATKTRHKGSPGEQPPPVNVSGIPYMQLPARLPARLRHLIPYHLARELRCAPVGRDHNRLTIALAQPTDAQTIEQLKKSTGMVIYPVACEISALDALLANEW